jgi:hypothetical protein
VAASEATVESRRMPPFKSAGRMVDDCGETPRWR